MKNPRWFTYIVWCSDGTLYCGVTPDVERRIRMHNEGRGAKYTKGRGPVRLVFLEIFPSKSEAMKYEASVKSLPKSAKTALIGKIQDVQEHERWLMVWASLCIQSPSSLVTKDQAFEASFEVSTRKSCFGRFSWAVATDEALKEIISRGPVVEMGAGSGYWTWLLRQKKVDVVAFDKFGVRGSPHPLNLWNLNGNAYSKVKFGTPESLGEFPKRNLLLCWPPNDDPMASDCLKYWKGRFLFYVGDFYGKTADSKFCELVRKDFSLIRGFGLPSWISDYDSMTIWERKKRK